MAWLGKAVSSSARSVPSALGKADHDGVFDISSERSGGETSSYAAIAAGAVLLTVNQRLARHHAQAYGRWQLARGRRAWETPAILPIRAWLATLHDHALADGLTQLARLPAIVEQRMWRQALGDEAAAALLDPDAAAVMASDARRIGLAWRCTSEADDYLSTDQAAWRQWSSTYIDACRADRLLDDAALADHVIDLLESPRLRAQLPRQVLLAGFLQMTPQQEAVRAALTATGIEVAFLPEGTSGEVRCDVHADDNAELCSVADEVRRVLESRHATTVSDHDLRERASEATSALSPFSLGVVIADLGQRRAEVLRAFDRAFFPGMTPSDIAACGRPYDLSLGLPLADYAVVRTALTLLALMRADITGGELSALLLSPYLAGARAQRRRHERLDRKLRERGLRRVTLATLCDELGDESEFARDGRRLLQGRTASRAPFSVWAERMAESLNLLGWPGDALDSDEHQTVQAWHDCLQDLQRLDDGGAVDEREALRVVTRLARERVFQPETPAVPVRIMGRLESHGIPFDQLWVTGLDAEQWPPVGSASPFLPMNRQKAAGVPEASAAVRLALAEREFARWRSATPLLIASHALERDGNPLSAAAVLAEAGMPSAPAHGVSADPAATIMVSGQRQSVVDWQGPSVPSGENLPGGARLFEDQAACPFRAFALHRLRVRPLEEVGLGLDPRRHGTLLHDALEAFWRDVRSHVALLAMDDDALAHAIASAVDTAIVAAIESSDREGEFGAALQALEKRRLTRLVEEWIRTCELPREPFVVESLESESVIEHGGIGMTLRLDRVDRVGDARVVLDYKTGTSSTITPWAEERVDNPQLPLYVMTDDTIDGVAFAQVARHACLFKGVASEGDLLPGVGTTVGEIDDWRDWRRHWSRALDRVAMEIRQGDARVAPKPKACQYCDLKPLCRIDPAETIDAVPDEEAALVADAGQDTVQGSGA